VFDVLFVDEKNLCGSDVRIYARLFFLVVCYDITPPEIYVLN